jgi:AbrB family looped-hinge helix DNA binding protein
MRVTTKGQVTIPQPIREKLGITAHSEVEFMEQDGRVYLVKTSAPRAGANKYRVLRGVATVRMTTDEIMALTRGIE